VGWAGLVRDIVVVVARVLGQETGRWDGLVIRNGAKGLIPVQGNRGVGWCS